MRISTAAGVGSVASLLAGVGVPIAFPDAQPWIGQALLLGAGLLLALVVGLWWPRKNNDEGSGTTQTTHGAHSPIFRDVHGSVTINPTPAATQPAKSPHGSGWNERSLAGLERVMRGGFERRSRAQALVERTAREERQRCPEMPIWQAVQHVASVIGDSDKENCYPEARSQIRQAALEQRIDVWGKHEIVPDHMAAPLRSRKVWKAIEPSYWEDYEIAAYAADPSTDDQPHTQMEEFFSGGSFNRYWSLRVRKHQVEGRWRRPMETTNDGKP